MIRLGSGGLALPSDSELLYRAVSLSIATGRAFRWEGFREDGLHPEEAEGVAALARLTDGRISGGTPGDAGLELTPGDLIEPPPRLELSPRDGFMPWLRAATLPLAARGGETRMRLAGSTHAPGGETFEVTETTFGYFLAELGLTLELVLQLAGFTPRGGGEVSFGLVAPSPAGIRAADWTARGELRSVRIVSAGASVPAHVQQRQAARASSGVRIAGATPNAQLVKLAARSAGSAVAVTGTFGRMPVTVAAISERGKSSEAVGDEAAGAFRRYQKQAGVVPSALCGSLLPFLCLTEHASRLTTEAPRDRLEVEAGLVRAFTGREVRVVGDGPGPAVVTVESGLPAGLQTS